MELIRGVRGLRACHRPCVATIGAFDGVHRGHQALIGQLREQGALLGLPMTVVSFEPLPREYLQPEQAPARLSTLREKHELLAAQGVDRLLLLRFDESVRQMGAEAFTQEILIDGLGVRSLIIGDDFRFGRARSGSTELMRELGAKGGFATLPTGTVLEGTERVSSTRVRAALARGEFALTERLLGRPYTLSGRVIYGRSLGRQLGFPTANIPLRRRLAPLRGVFAVTVDGAGLNQAAAVANVGARPTVESAGDTMLEVHVLDAAPLLYGKRLTVTPRQRLRDEQKFDSIEALGAQISRDKEQAQQFFAAQTAPTTHS